MLADYQCTERNDSEYQLTNTQNMSPGVLAIHTNHSDGNILYKCKTIKSTNRITVYPNQLNCLKRVQKWHRLKSEYILFCP